MGGIAFALIILSPSQPQSWLWPVALHPMRAAKLGVKRGCPAQIGDRLLESQTPPWLLPGEIHIADHNEHI